MIYSIVPMDQILFSHQNNNTIRMEMMLHGERLVLIENDKNTYTLERVISTNPKTYLMPEMMPGTLFMTLAANKDDPGAVWEIINKN